MKLPSDRKDSIAFGLTVIHPFPIRTTFRSIEMPVVPRILLVSLSTANDLCLSHRRYQMRHRLALAEKRHLATALAPPRTVPNSAIVSRCKRLERTYRVDVIVGRRPTPPSRLS